MSLRRQRTSRLRRGFTLVELMVALSAGLILMMWMTQLSGMVMQTYHDETRSYETETTLRIAAERLRADLQAASFMSSPNMYSDPLLARATTTANPGTQWSTGALGGVNRVAGVFYTEGGSYDTDSSVKNWSALTANSLRPDSIRVTGNMTTADEYIGYIVDTNVANSVPSGGGAAVACTSGVKIRLSNDDPAVLRLKGGDLAQALASARRAFLPTYGANVRGAHTPVSGKTFMARVVEPTGKYFNMAPVCDVQLEADSVIVYLSGPSTTADESLAVVSSRAAGGLGGGIAGFSPITINPVQTVEWRIRRGPDATMNRDGFDPRFELVRQWIGVDDSGGDAAVMGNPEVIADYAVDLKFAFTFTTQLSPPLDTEYGWGDLTAAGKLDQTLATREPQRLRRIRFRIQVRNAMADSTAAAPGPGDGYLYRYDMTAPAGANGVAPSGAGLRFARVRTFTSEVALLNQTRIW